MPGVEEKIRQGADPSQFAPRDYMDFEEGTTQLYMLKSLVVRPSHTRTHTYTSCHPISNPLSHPPISPPLPPTPTPHHPPLSPPPPTTPLYPLLSGA